MKLHPAPVLSIDKRPLCHARHTLNGLREDAQPGAIVGWFTESGTVATWRPRFPQAATVSP
jgi:hypothetical protein